MCIVFNKRPSSCSKPPPQTPELILRSFQINTHSVATVSSQHCLIVLHCLSGTHLETEKKPVSFFFLFPEELHLVWLLASSWALHTGASSDVPAPMDPAPRGYHEERRFMSTQQEMCVLLIVFLVCEFGFFFYYRVLKGQRGRRAFSLSHCCVRLDGNFI